MVRIFGREDELSCSNVSDGYEIHGKGGVYEECLPDNFCMRTDMILNMRWRDTWHGKRVPGSPGQNDPIHVIQPNKLLNQSKLTHPP